MYGRVVATRELTDGTKTKTEFSLEQLAGGTYMVRVNADGIVYTGKLQVETR
jgi:hypothetical protein